MIGSAEWLETNDYELEDELSALDDDYFPWISAKQTAPQSFFSGSSVWGKPH